MPKYFELSARQKAFILIHEAVVRRTGNFLIALHVDRAILDLQNPSVSPVKPFNILKYYFSTKPSWEPIDSIDIDPNLMELAMSSFERQVGRALELNDIADLSSIERMQHSQFVNIIDISPINYVNTTKLFPEFEDIFGMGKAELGLADMRDLKINSNATALAVYRKACATASKPDAAVAVPIYSKIETGSWSSHAGTHYFESFMAFVPCDVRKQRWAVVGKFGDLFKSSYVIDQ